MASHRSRALPGCSPPARPRRRSIARHLSAVRGLYRFLLARGRVPRDPTEHLDSPRPPGGCPARCPCEDAAALVEAPDTTRPDGLRDRALLELLYASGLRASEALGLRLEDVNFKAGYVMVIGKGRPAAPRARRGRRRSTGCAATSPRSARASVRRECPALFLNRSGGAAVAAGPLGHRPARGAPRGPPRPRSRRTPCATPSRAICSSAAPTCARCRPCSATSTSRPRRSTRTCRRASSTTCTGSSTRGRRAWPGSLARAASSERAEMAKAGHVYPQVEPGVAALMDRARACAARPACPWRGRSPARARPARTRGRRSARGRAVRAAELARAAAWGLDRRLAREVAWRGLPSVAARRLRDRRAAAPAGGRAARPGARRARA